MKKTWNVVAWILAALLAYIFAFAGGAKLVGIRAMVLEFARVGIGQWFRSFTGLLEVTGAAGVLIPKFRFWAALQIAAVMIGATIANLTVLHMPILAPFTALLLAAALSLAWLRQPQTRSRADNA